MLGSVRGFRVFWTPLAILVGLILAPALANGAGAFEELGYSSRMEVPMKINLAVLIFLFTSPAYADSRIVAIW